MVAPAGLEPARSFELAILSRVRLPFRHGALLPRLAAAGQNSHRNPVVSIPVLCGCSCFIRKGRWRPAHKGDMEDGLGNNYTENIAGFGIFFRNIGTGGE